MKNATTHFSSTGNGFLYYRSGCPKYKNVKLVPVSHAGYQAYCRAYISANKSKRPDGYVAEQPSMLCRASRTVEHIVRNWYGSQPNRIIQYDVLYNGVYQHHYKECDIIRIETDGAITIGEIKSSSKPSHWQASSKLQNSTEILSTVLPVVNPVAEYITSNRPLYHSQICRQVRVVILS